MLAINSEKGKKLQKLPKYFKKEIISYFWYNFLKLIKLNYYLLYIKNYNNGKRLSYQICWSRFKPINKIDIKLRIK